MVDIQNGVRIYHWKHGWIPLDHFAALQKAHYSERGAQKALDKAHAAGYAHRSFAQTGTHAGGHGAGAHLRAADGFQPVANEHLRRDKHIIAAFHPASRNFHLLDTQRGHTAVISEADAREIHLNGQKIIGISKSESGGTQIKVQDMKNGRVHRIDAVRDHLHPVGNGEHRPGDAKKPADATVAVRPAEHAGIVDGRKAQQEARARADAKRAAMKLNNAPKPAADAERAKVERAASAFEFAGDYKRAADAHEQLGNYEKADELRAKWAQEPKAAPINSAYIRNQAARKNAQQRLDAERAKLHEREGNYAKAAEYYERAAMPRKVAQMRAQAAGLAQGKPAAPVHQEGAFTRAVNEGNAAAAAGDHARAAELYSQGGAHVLAKQQRALADRNANARAQAVTNAVAREQARDKGQQLKADVMAAQLAAPGKNLAADDINGHRAMFNKLNDAHMAAVQNGEAHLAKALEPHVQAAKEKALAANAMRVKAADAQANGGLTAKLNDANAAVRAAQQEQRDHLKAGRYALARAAGAKADRARDAVAALEAQRPKPPAIDNGQRDMAARIAGQKYDPYNAEHRAAKKVALQLQAEYKRLRNPDRLQAKRAEIENHPGILDVHRDALLAGIDRKVQKAAVAADAKRAGAVQQQAAAEAMKGGAVDQHFHIIQAHPERFDVKSSSKNGQVSDTFKITDKQTGEIAWRKDDGQAQYGAVKEKLAADIGNAMGFFQHRAQLDIGANGKANHVIIEHAPGVEGFGERNRYKEQAVGEAIRKGSDPASFMRMVMHDYLVANDEDRHYMNFHVVDEGGGKMRAAILDHGRAFGGAYSDFHHAPEHANFNEWHGAYVRHSARGWDAKAVARAAYPNDHEASAAYDQIVAQMKQVNVEDVIHQAFNAPGIDQLPSYRADQWKNLIRQRYAHLVDAKNKAGIIKALKGA